MTRPLDVGSLLRLDAQDALATARSLEETWPREVLETMTADELLRVVNVLELAAVKLKIVAMHAAAARRLIVREKAHQ